jgi:Ubiquitin carboxyl-terminal hydrolase/Bone sialoprotein II (BSP-II)
MDISLPIQPPKEISLLELLEMHQRGYGGGGKKSKKKKRQRYTQPDGFQHSHNFSSKSRKNARKKKKGSAWKQLAREQEEEQRRIAQEQRKAEAKRKAIQALVKLGPKVALDIAVEPHKAGMVVLTIAVTDRINKDTICARPHIEPIIPEVMIEHEISDDGTVKLHTRVFPRGQNPPDGHCPPPVLVRFHNQVLADAHETAAAAAAAAVTCSDEKYASIDSVIVGVGDDAKHDHASLVRRVSLPDFSSIGFNRLQGPCVLNDCLSAFTDPEHLTGPDKFGCTACTKRHILATSAITDDNVTNDDDDDDDNKSTSTDVDAGAGAGAGDSTSSDDESDSDDDDGDDDEEEEEEEEEEEALRELIQNSLIKKEAIKRFSILKAPRVLTLHLKRFMETPSGYEKVDKRVSFGFDLDLTPFMDDQSSPCHYRLYGIVEHSGSMRGGHYVAYVRKEFSWYYFSDTHFHAITADQALSAQAYMLFYERV